MDAGKFAGLMDGLGLDGAEWSRGVAVGASGGADSTALALMLRDWTALRGISLLALCCDHGLRSGSAGEARWTAETMRSLGIECRVLRIEVAPGTGVQARARDARYAAMLAAMRASGVGVLAVGHHRLDQAETVEHRLERGACTPAGLAGMQPVRVAEDALLVRPLLGCDPADLRGMLRAAGVGWVEDPSNADPRYARVRIRQMLQAAPERVEELLRIAQANAGQVWAIRAGVASRLEEAGLERHPGGACHLLCPDQLGTDATAAEAVRWILRSATGGSPAAGAAALLRLVQGGGGTLGGAAVWRTGRSLWLAREMASVPGSLPALAGATWDRRIRFGKRVPPDTEVACLGDAGATALRHAGQSDLPHRVLATLPCLRRELDIVSIPQLGMGEHCTRLPYRRDEPVHAPIERAVQGLRQQPS